MSSQTDIPRKSIYRLSIYQRCLERLRENGLETVSSNALAKAAGVKSTQLRKDLAHFGQFGTRGLGYNVEALIEVITGVLGPQSNAHGPNEFLHIPFAKRLTCCISSIIADYK